MCQPGCGLGPRPATPGSRPSAAPGTTPRPASQEDRICCPRCGRPMRARTVVMAPVAMRHRRGPGDDPRRGVRSRGQDRGAGRPILRRRQPHHDQGDRPGARRGSATPGPARPLPTALASATDHRQPPSVQSNASSPPCPSPPCLLGRGRVRPGHRQAPNLTGCPPGGPGGVPTRDGTPPCRRPRPARRGTGADRPASRRC